MYKFWNDYANELSRAMGSIEQKDLQEFQQGLGYLSYMGHKVFVAGNGGSAAVAEHTSCDFNKGVGMDTYLRPCFIPLASNVSVVTAIANDISYDEIFAKQIEWYCDSQSALLVISASGNSKNIIRALEAAKSKGLKTFALVGFDGGLVKERKLAQNLIHVDCSNYGVVEDVHMIIMHTISQYLRVKDKLEGVTPKL